MSRRKSFRCSFVLVFDRRSLARVYVYVIAFPKTEVPPRRGELPSETITRRDFPALGKIYYMTTIDETFT